MFQSGDFTFRLSTFDLNFFQSGSENSNSLHCTGMKMNMLIAYLNVQAVDFLPQDRNLELGFSQHLFGHETTHSPHNSKEIFLA
mmetsp:Transcript_9186/g.26434  ORF Transcript_9186/g.26434 Transcript_9186/m.26434 type:complete len:84 (+) Transcript_9186:1337-1588(+)